MTCAYAFDGDDEATWPAAAPDPVHVDRWSCPFEAETGPYCRFHDWRADGSVEPADEEDGWYRDRLIAAAERGEPVVGAVLPGLSIRGRRILGEVWLLASVVHGDVDARGATFDGEVRLSCTVDGDLDLAESRVSDRLYLDGTRVTGTLNLMNARVEDYLSATGLVASEKLILKGGTVEGWAALGGRNAHYGRLNCRNWSVDGYATFQHATVDGRASFGDASIGGGLDLDGLSAGGAIRLDDATVGGTATLTGVSAGGGLVADGATVATGSRIAGGRMDPPPSFERATLRGVRVEGDVFRDADLRAADLTDAALADASLRGATLERAVLTRASFHGADLRGTRTAGSVFADATIDDATRLPARTPYEGTTDGVDGGHSVDGSGEDGGRDDDNGGGDGDADLRAAADAHRAFAELARRNSIPEVASDHYLKRKRLLAKRHRRSGRTLLYLRARASDLVVEYGENPYRVVATAATIIGMTTLLYPLGLIERSDGTPVSYLDASGALRPPGELGAVLLDSLYFSTVTFTTLGFGDFRPVGFGRALATVETSAGVVLLALLVFVFGRRATR